MNTATSTPGSAPTAISDNPEISQASTEIPADAQALAAAITRLAGHINAAQYRFLKLLVALVEREVWDDGGGIKSPAHWLNYYCGIDLGAAREKVRVAICLAELPQIDEAFASGAISYSKVRAMTRSATPQNEAYLLNIARHGTAQHMEMLVRKHQRVQRLMQGQGQSQSGRGAGVEEAAAAQFAGRQLLWHYDDDGMLVIHARLTPEDGAMFIKAVDSMFAQLPQMDGGNKAQPGSVPEGDSENDSERDSANDSKGSSGSDSENVSAETLSEYPTPESSKDVSAETFFRSQESNTDTFAQKRADALVLLAEQSFQHSGQDLAPLTPPQRHQLIIHIEKDSIMQSADHHCSIEQGPFLSPASARRLACDTALLTVLEDNQGNVLNVGRKTRSVSPALRRALTIRDHCCRFPGCTEARFVDAHHIQHWCDGGETSLENLVLLCRRHHRLVHEQGFEVINRGSGNIEFRRPDRRVLPEALFPQFREQEAYGETLAIEREHQRMGLDVDEFTAITQWRGERMDYSMAVEGILGSTN